MSGKYRRLAMAMVVGIAWSITASVKADVLFFDDFAATNQSDDVNFMYDQGRQSGTIAPTPYLQGYGTWGVISGSLANEAGNGWQTQINNGGSEALWLVGQGGADIASVSLEHNFIENPGIGNAMMISFDLDPAAGGWGGVTIGADDNSSFGAAGAGARGQFINDAAPHFGFLLGESGSWEAFDGNAGLPNGSVAAPASAVSVLVQVEGLVDGNPWDGSGDAAVSVFLDGSLATAFTKTGGYTNNWITLQGYSSGFDVQSFDNFQVEVAVAIPEPATLGLIAVFGSGILFIRRRFLI